MPNAVGGDAIAPAVWVVTLAQDVIVLAKTALAGEIRRPVRTWRPQEPRDGWPTHTESLLQFEVSAFARLILGNNATSQIQR